jgi:integrase/recombinase XerD
MDAVWTLAAVSLSAAADLAKQDRHGLMTVSPDTARWFRQSARSLVNHLGRDVGVESLTPLQVSEWVRAEVDRGVSPVSVNSRLRAIKTMYSRLEKRGVVGFNPAAPVPFLAEPPARPRAVAVEDYLAMRAVATSARDRAILDVLWASGCRLGGLLSMRVDRIERWEQNGRWCYALLAVEKFDRPRWVYVGRDALQSAGLSEWLDERPLGGPWLWLSFAAPYGQMAKPTVEGLLRRLRIAADIPAGRPCNAHGFRHAFAVRMLDEGEDLAAVSAWLGHHSPEFTAAVYAIRPERALREKYFGR